MDPKNLRFKGLFGDAPQAPEEDYNTYDPQDSHNQVAAKVNPILDKYVNPALEKTIGKVNEYLPFQIPENVRMDEISKGERQELNNFGDAADQMGGFMGGISTGSKNLSPAMHAIRDSMEARLAKIKALPDSMSGKADMIKDVEGSISNLFVNTASPVKALGDNIKVNNGSGKFGKIIVR